MFFTVRCILIHLWYVCVERLLFLVLLLPVLCQKTSQQGKAKGLLGLQFPALSIQSKIWCFYWSSTIVFCLSMPYYRFFGCDALNFLQYFSLDHENLDNHRSLWRKFGVLVTIFLIFSSACSHPRSSRPSRWPGECHQLDLHHILQPRTTSLRVLVQGRQGREHISNLVIQGETLCSYFKVM